MIIQKLFARVVLPLSLPGTYTYLVPEEMQGRISVGQRVVVQFGRKKFFSAVVISLSEEIPEDFEVKEIIQILDDQPIVHPVNIELWRWIADYYCCSLGEVYRAALPPGLKLESKSKVFLTGNDKEYVLTEKEYYITEQLRQNVSSLEKLQRILGKNFSYKALQMLLGRDIVRIEERIITRYKPLIMTYIGLDPHIKSGQDLNDVIENLNRAKKQRALLIHFFEKTNIFGDDEKPIISKKELLEGTDLSNSVLNELIKKRILNSQEREISRLESHEVLQLDINMLNDRQGNALAEIKEGFDKNKVVLMHGVTASGKTEIYIHLMDEAVKSGQQVLYLVPEIVLTTQLTKRLKSVFGRKAGIYHSRLNNQERVEIWQKVLRYRSDKDDGYQIILGARSAVFLPFSGLGLIIVDEEHENSYKQFDPAPRYNGRDMAVILGAQNNANVLLGSATPSYESYFNAMSGKYKLVSLTERYSDSELPEIIVADLKKAWKKRQMKSLLTPELYGLINDALAKDEQVILFQNRRGYSPYIQCFDCGWIPKCKNCDVSLTYHKYKKRLVCHYCGYQEEVPEECIKCGSGNLKKHGYGTEKIEDEIKSLFPQARIDRMDLDTTHSRDAFPRIIRDLETGKTDILIGTQMVTKGLDLDHVTVAGILNADNLMNFPDFRAHERAFQLIYQVSGRTGRRHNRGKVVVQTSDPGHPLIKLIKEHNYEEAYRMQMEERRLFKYPPWYRLIKVIIRHKNPEIVNRVARRLADQLKGSRLFIVLGPEYPLVSRIKLYYQKEIWLKINRKMELDAVKEVITDNISKIKNNKESRNCIINIDVDPF
jgi:primosomal protein N' (replication factor Y) (superfamily II helicase)